MSEDATSKGTAQALMNYIDAEVRAVCSRYGWRHQIRRKWSVRDEPVSMSGIDDYEWKLITTPGDNNLDSYDGTYYVLGLSDSFGKLVLQHDTQHVGILTDDWFTRTCTEIDLWSAAMSPLLSEAGGPPQGNPENWARSLPPQGDPTHWAGPLPAQGVLERFLLALTARFRPNSFSRT